MPVLVHTAHPGTHGTPPIHEPVHAEPHPPRPRWFLPVVVAAAVLVVLVLAGITLHFVSGSSSNVDTDAQLATLQRQRSARAHVSPRPGTAAGVAGRILAGQSGRRAQESELLEGDERVKPSP